MATTHRLIIEPRAVEHAPGLFAALDHPDVGTFIGGPDVTTLAALEERITQVLAAHPEEWGERWLNWTVWAADEPGRPVVGRIEATVHLHAGAAPTAEVAYVFGPAWWGRGYATEATRWMLDHLRDEHGVTLVYATVDPANAASVAVLERLGFAPCDLPADGSASSYDPGDLVFRTELPPPGAGDTVEWRGGVANDELNALHAEAFDTRVFTADEWDWETLLARHSLGWVTARDAGGQLVGFANVLWDGLVHAWIQDVMVAASVRRAGVGRSVVAAAAAGARAAGCEWLHVDFDDEHRAFYIDACGFTPTNAGLIALQE